MKLQLTDAEVNHMRRVLAWMRVEYCLDENMQRGSLEAVKQLLDSGNITQEQAEHAITRNADQIRQVPQYIRQAVKMLTKTLREHDGVEGAIVDASTRTVQYIEQEARK